MADDKEPPEVDLGKFEGRRIAGTRFKLNGTGAALRVPAELNPAAMKSGEDVNVVFACKIGPVEFDPVTGTHTSLRIHILEAHGAFVDTDGVLPGVDKLIADQEERYKKMLETEAGINQFPDTDGIPVGDSQKAQGATKAAPPKADAAKKVADAKDGAKAKLSSVQGGKSDTTPAKAAAAKKS